MYTLGPIYFVNGSDLWRGGGKLLTQMLTNYKLILYKIFHEIVNLIFFAYIKIEMF